MNEEIEDNESLDVELENNQDVKTEVDETLATTDETIDSEVQEEDEETLIVTIGDAEPEQEPEPAPSWVRELRKQNRELKKQLKEKEQLEIKKTELKLEPKPTLESCNYDEELKDQKLIEWYEKKKKFEAQETEKKKTVEAQEKEWQDRRQKHNQLKEELRVKDYDEAEDLVKEKLGVNEQGIIIHAAKNSALVVYALSKNEKKLDEMSKIKDPIKFAYELAKLETELKVTGRKAKPAPETTLKASGGTATTSSKALEKLREDAIKSGDFTAYQKAKRAKQKE